MDINIGSYLIRLVVVSLIFLAILFGSLYYLRKRGFGMVFKKGKNIEIIESMPLGQGKGIYIVKIYDKRFIIGVTQNGFSVISSFPDKE